MRRAIVLGALVSCAALTMKVAASQQAGAAGQATPRVVAVQKVRDNLYMLTGGGGNSAVFITATGVTVVDTKNPGWGQPPLDKIATLTDKPVIRIINTQRMVTTRAATSNFR